MGVFRCGMNGVMKELHFHDKERQLCSLNPESSFCPSMPWWSGAAIEKVTLVFVLSIFCGLCWHSILVMHVIWLAIAIGTCFPVTLQQDGEPEYKYLICDWSTCLGLACTVFSQLVVLRATYQQAHSQRKCFVKVIPPSSLCVIRDCDVVLTFMLSKECST